MRTGDPTERPTIQLDDEDYLAATEPLRPTQDEPVDPPPTSRRPLDERILIDELWRISHFGWIPETAIRRALTLVREREIPSDGLHQDLRELLNRGLLEYRDKEGDGGDQHWRLTDSGRHARVS